MSIENSDITVNKMPLYNNSRLWVAVSVVCAQSVLYFRRVEVSVFILDVWASAVWALDFEVIGKILVRIFYFPLPAMVYCRIWIVFS